MFRVFVRWPLIALGEIWFNFIAAGLIDFLVKEIRPERYSFQLITFNNGFWLTSDLRPYEIKQNVLKGVRI